MELAEDYEALVRDGARVGPWNAGGSTRSAAFKRWAGYLRTQAELDGLRINHSWYMHISFPRPVIEVAQRANGRHYDLPLWARPRIPPTKRNLDAQEGENQRLFERRLQLIEDDWDEIIAGARARATRERKRLTKLR